MRHRVSDRSLLTLREIARVGALDVEAHRIRSIDRAGDAIQVRIAGAADTDIHEITRWIATRKGSAQADAVRAQLTASLLRLGDEDDRRHIELRDDIGAGLATLRVDVPDVAVYLVLFRTERGDGGASRNVLRVVDAAYEESGES